MTYEQQRGNPLLFCQNNEIIRREDDSMGEKQHTMIYMLLKQHFEKHY